VKLLVAVDFSPQTEHILAAARDLARALGAQLWLMHVVAPPPVLPRHNDAGPDQPPIALEDREQQRLIQEAADSARDAGVEATGVLVEGPPAKMILRQAATLQADMIIIGSHGFGPALEMLLGSVSKKVLKKARCPVLVVPIPRSEE